MKMGKEEDSILKYDLHRIYQAENLWRSSHDIS
jgi:hypothetical protein